MTENRIDFYCENCHNPAVTVERDVRLTPSSKACAGCTSEKSEPGEILENTFCEVDDPMTHGTTPTAENVVPTTGVAAPARPKTIREFERSLRGLGFSQRESKNIALHGFKLSDENPDLSQLAEKLEELADIFRK